MTIVSIKYLFGIFFVTLVMIFLSCKNDKGKLIPKTQLNSNSPAPQPVSGCGNLTSVSYSLQIEPIMNTRCNLPACHNANAGIKLTNYSDVLLVANSGQLVGAINGDVNYVQMPPNSLGYASLDSCQIQTIYWWVQQGKLNN